eukprot:gene203-4449_t
MFSNFKKVSLKNSKKYFKSSRIQLFFETPICLQTTENIVDKYENAVKLWKNIETHDKALQIFDSAARNGHEPSQIFLINLYLQEEIDVTGEDLDELFHYTESICKKDHGHGLYLMSKMYKKQTTNFEQYFECLLKSSQKGYIKATIELAEYYKSIKNFKKSFNYFQIGANQNDAHCQYQLGMMYYYGEGVEQNDDKSLEYFKLSANQEFTESEFRLGVYYLLIEIENIKLGIEYLKKASNKGHKDAKDLLNSYNQQNEE